MVESSARARRTVWLEGNQRSRNLVVEFPSVEVAEQCYQSPAYLQALEFARDAAIRDLCIVEAS